MTEQQETLRLLRSQSLASAVQEEIEQRILSGAIPAGARINENGLSAELGISRGPIREACRSLVQVGLLTVIVNRGFFVRSITHKDATDIYNVRASLMRLAGETLASDISDAQLRVLRDLVEKMDRAEACEDFDEFFDLNRDFHDLIVDFADNDRLRALHEGLVKELHLYRRRSILLGGGMRHSNAEHKTILSALEARNSLQAGAALETHIQAGKQRFFDATSGDE